LALGWNLTLAASNQLILGSSINAGSVQSVVAIGSGAGSGEIGSGGTGGIIAIGQLLTGAIGNNTGAIGNIGHGCKIGSNCSTVYAYGYNLIAGAGVNHSQIIGDNITIGAGSAEIIAIASHNTGSMSIPAGVSGIIAIGSRHVIGVYSGAIVLGDSVTTTGTSSIGIGTGGTAAQSSIGIGVGFNVDFYCNAFGSNCTALTTGGDGSGAPSMAFGVSGTAGGGQCIFGDSSHVGVDASVHEFIVRGLPGLTNPVDTLKAIHNPAALGNIGLFVTYNDGTATIVNKQLLAAAAPPAGSLYLYIAP
jgi:hypothetical protein